MRAQHQIKLLEALKGLKVKLGLKNTEDPKQELGTTSTIFRMKTQPM